MKKYYNKKQQKPKHKIETKKSKKQCNAIEI